MTRIAKGWARVVVLVSLFTSALALFITQPAVAAVVHQHKM
jgi:hypothetical protein